MERLRRIDVTIKRGSEPLKMTFRKDPVAITTNETRATPITESPLYKLRMASGLKRARFVRDAYPEAHGWFSRVRARVAEVEKGMRKLNSDDLQRLSKVLSERTNRPLDEIIVQLLSLHSIDAPNLGQRRRG